MTEPLLKDLSSPGRRTSYLADLDVPGAELPPSEYLRSGLDLPEVGELDIVRHFVRLSEKNFAVDVCFYPLGSCTMKYNPKINEDVASVSGFTAIHPYQPLETVQGALQILFELQGFLAEITGMSGVSLQPAAGAHGELAGMLIVKAYHDGRGDTARRIVIVPDSAHGTNPATASMCGYEVATVKSDKKGNVDLDALRALMSDKVAGVMLTLPNTLGLFDPNILEISTIIHESGALLYGDGANMNAILGQVKHGDLGFDVIHLNLHKTFSTPHGGGGPGSGPICVKAHLAPFLPSPIVARAADGVGYVFGSPPSSIGRVRSFYGNFALNVRAYAYIRALGADGLREVSENAVLNANYLMGRLKGAYDLPYDRACMHEFVLSGSRQKKGGVRTMDMAKRLIDFGFHPPTVYFPLIVDEALMIEPTETESRTTIDAFAEAMLQIAGEAVSNPDIVKTAPHNTPVSRLDEVEAARHPNLRW